MRVAILTSGLTQPSSTRLLGDQLGAAVRSTMPSVDVVSIDLREYAHDLTNNLLTGFPSSSLRAVLDTVAEADGLIAVTPTFSASYSGLFKTFFDVLDDNVLEGKPVLMAATGGTERHSLVIEYAMRPLFAYLRAAPIPTGVYAATSDFATSALQSRVTRAATELITAMQNAPIAGPTDPFDDPTPFAELLAQ